MRAFSTLIILFSSLSWCGELITQLKKTTEKFPQVELQEVGQSVLITGKVNRLEQLWELKSITDSLKRSGELIANAVLLSDEGYQELAKAIEEKIGSAEITVKRVGDSLFVEGVAASDFQADKNILIAKMMITQPASTLSRTPSKEKETSPALLMTLIDMQVIKKTSKPAGKKD